MHCTVKAQQKQQQVCVMPSYKTNKTKQNKTRQRGGSLHQCVLSLIYLNALRVYDESHLAVSLGPCVVLCVCRWMRASVSACMLDVSQHIPQQATRRSSVYHVAIPSHHATPAIRSHCFSIPRHNVIILQYYHTDQKPTASNTHTTSHHTTL